MENSRGAAHYLAGATVARAGDEMSAPALLLAGYAATGSAATASLLLSGITISAAAGGPLLGAILDRASRPGRLLATALAATAAVQLAAVCVYAAARRRSYTREHGSYTCGEQES